MDNADHYPRVTIFVKIICTVLQIYRVDIILPMCSRNPFLIREVAMNDRTVRIATTEVECCCVLLETCEVIGGELTHLYSVFAASLINLPADERCQVIEFLDRRGYRLPTWEESKKMFLADLLSEIILRSFREGQK